MKTHKKKEQCFANSGLPEDQRAAFYAGWYACGIQINEGEDYDDFQDRLTANDFLPPDEKCGACHGSGWVVRDADIGTDQECPSCDGKGASHE